VQGAGDFLFDSEEHLIRVDMSEFMEKHSVARLIGAPPGYVGYEEGGYLTEAVRRKPYSVILLDEVEKAHHDVFNVLLQVLDDGRLTDGQGRTVDFKNTVIVMTSNIGSHMIQAMVGKPYEDVKEAVWDELKNHFRPEFLNRIDETVVFHGLDAKNIARSPKIQLRVLEQRLAKMDLHLQVSPAALEELAKVGFDPVFGARPLKRAIQQRIENPLSRLILEGRSQGHDRGHDRPDPVAGQVLVRQGRGTNGGRLGLKRDDELYFSGHSSAPGAGFRGQPGRGGDAAGRRVGRALRLGAPHGQARYPLGDALQPALRLRQISPCGTARGAHGRRHGQCARTRRIGAQPHRHRPRRRRDRRAGPPRAR
jgi:hypothetical protein